MINVEERLEETNKAIECLLSNGIEVPLEAVELQEIMRRCIAAEMRLPDVDSASHGVGQEAYEAYARHTQWKSLATGSQLPQWDALSDEIRAAWNVAAAWVVGVALRRLGVQ